MSNDLAISVQNIGKAYRIWESPAARLTAPLTEALARVLPEESSFAHGLRAHAAKRYRDFWALKSVSFDVHKGEAVGIIGRNGSGKSTLLQIVAGTLQPTTGSVRTIGRVAALLELGSGFNPEFSGRENVYLNAAVLGFTRAQTDARFDQIAAFADIGDFIDQPVKTYSSGMVVRLAFAVQTSVSPDLFIVDEALAVGDAPFQAKCFARMREMTAQGTTLLLVSHDLGSIRALCQQALYLVKGSSCALGLSKQVCDAYERQCYRDQGIAFPETPPVDLPAIEPNPNDIFLNPEFSATAARQRSGSGALRLLDLCVTDSSGAPINRVAYDQTVSIRFVLHATTTFHGSIVSSLLVKDLKGRDILEATDKENDCILSLQTNQRVVGSVPFTFPLKADQYYITMSIFRFPTDSKFINGIINFASAELLDLVEYGCFFDVDWYRPWCHYGPVFRPTRFTYTPLSPH